LVASERVCALWADAERKIDPPPPAAGSKGVWGQIPLRVAIFTTF